MHDNSARQSWTLDPGATSALGSTPSATQFQPSGQAWASEVSKRTQHGARSSLQAHPPSFSPLKGKRCPTGRLYFPKTTVTTLENEKSNNQRYPFHEIPGELEKHSAKGPTTYQQKRGLILLSQDLWIAREPVEGSRRFRLSSAQQASSSWLSVSLRTASLKTHKRYFPRLLQKHKVRLHSKQTSDPVHSDLLEQEERTPGQSRWSSLSVMPWIGACVGDSGLMKSRV